MSEAEVIVDEKVPVVHIIREFDAPPEKVFRAHVDPDLFLRWNWPEGFDVTFDHFDCRTGGAYRISMAGGGYEATVHGCFHDVIPNERIVQTFGNDGDDGVVLETHRFEDLGDGRTRLTATSLVESFEYRDAAVAQGMASGLTEGYDKLDVLLTEL